MKVGMPTLFIDITIAIVAIGFLFFFFSKPLRKSVNWHATVTPLASIIGSGFLIVAPLLWILVGYGAIWVMLGVVFVAYCIGAVIRFNIHYVEPLLLKAERGRYFSNLNKVSYLTLAISYFISVAFYVRILSAFALKGIGIEDPFFAQVLTTLILLVIGFIGYFKGFDWLELLEVYSVNIKMSVIIMFLCGLFLYDWFVLDFHSVVSTPKVEYSFLTLRKVFGILLVVQGFEISRYLGHKYSRAERIKTMKLAQVISAFIYVFFILLILFLMGEDQHITETEIIDLSQNISILLPLAITIGALFSQFSAVIADTVGCGGIIGEYSRNKISHNISYLSITLGAIFLIWVSNVYEIVAFASRMFAAYYLSQCLEAFYVNSKYNFRGHRWSIFFVGVGILMACVLIFGISAD